MEFLCCLATFIKKYQTQFKTKNKKNILNKKFYLFKILYNFLISSEKINKIIKS